LQTTLFLSIPFFLRIVTLGQKLSLVSPQIRLKMHSQLGNVIWK